MNRNSLLWQDTLRSQTPKLETIVGLNFINLSNNPSIGDEGFREVASALAEDIWITGVVFENCGLTSTIRVAIEDLLKNNQKLESLNISRNPFLDSQVSTEVTQKMKIRKLPNSEICEKPKLRYPTNVMAEKHNHKIRLEIPTKVWPQKEGIPYRVEQRILERRENLPVGALTNLLKDFRRAKPKTPYERDVNYVNLKNIRKLLQYYKGKLSKEKKKRIKAETEAQKMKRRLYHTEKEIAEKYLIDEVTLSYIEKCLERIPLLENICKTVYNEKIENIEDPINELAQLGDTAVSTTDASGSLYERRSIEKSKLCTPNSPRQFAGRDKSIDRKKKRYRIDSLLKITDSSKPTTNFSSESETLQDKKESSESIIYKELKKSSSRSRSSDSGKEVTSSSKKNLNGKLVVKNMDNQSISDSIDYDHNKKTLLNVQLEIDDYQDNPSCHEDLSNSRTRTRSSMVKSKFDHHSSASPSCESEENITNSIQSMKRRNKISNNTTSPQDKEKKTLEDKIKDSMENSHHTQEKKSHVVNEAKNCSNFSSQRSSHLMNLSKEIENSCIVETGVLHSCANENPLVSTIGNAPSQNAFMEMHTHCMQCVPAKDFAPNLLLEKAKTSEQLNQHNVPRNEENATASELHPINNIPLMGITEASTSENDNPKTDLLDKFNSLSSKLLTIKYKKGGNLVDTNLHSNDFANNDEDIDIFIPPMRVEQESSVTLYKNQKSLQKKFPLRGIAEEFVSEKESTQVNLNNNLNNKASELLPIKLNDNVTKLDDRLQYHGSTNKDDKSLSKTDENNSESFDNDDIDHNLLAEEAVATEYKERPLVSEKSKSVQLTEISGRPMGYTRDDFKYSKSFISEEDIAKPPYTTLASSPSIEEEIVAAPGSEDHSSFS